MKKALTYTKVAIGVIFILVMSNYIDGKVHDHFNRPEPQISATSTPEIEVRDWQRFTLTPTMVEEEADWSKYVDIMEGDSISIIVTKP